MQPKNIRLTVLIIALIAAAGIIWASAKDDPKVADNNTDTEVTDTTPNTSDDVDTETPTKNDDKPDTNEDVDIPSSFTLDVPFTSQAPLGGWDDIEQQDGCEEASMLMAWHWSQGTTFKSADDALKQIKDYNKFENDNYGNSLDTSAADTLKIFKDYFDYDKARLVQNPTTQDIVKELAAGNVVVAPFNGKALNNPNFTGGGPDRHMLLIKGYNESKKEFITNDPGTRNGRSYRYSYDTIMSAMRDYETGFQVPIKGNSKVMIVVEK